MGFACFRLRGPRKRPRGVRGNAPTKKKSPGPIRTGAPYVPSASAALGSPVKGFPLAPPVRWRSLRGRHLRRVSVVIVHRITSFARRYHGWRVPPRPASGPPWPNPRPPRFARNITPILGQAAPDVNRSRPFSTQSTLRFSGPRRDRTPQVGRSAPRRVRPGRHTRSSPPPARTRSPSVDRSPSMAAVVGEPVVRRIMVDVVGDRSWPRSAGWRIDQVEAWLDERRLEPVEVRPGDGTGA